MEATLFVRALLGHLIGDYLVQSKYMALHKADPGWRGAYTCTLHVIFTQSLCLMLQVADPIVWVLVFVPHWVIDRWSLASLHLRMIRGRTFAAAHASKDQCREVDVAFTSIVYTVVDNTFHLLSLWTVIVWVML